MRKLTKFAVDFLKREDGPTAVEYAVMLALIIVVCIAAITTLGSNANNTFSNVAGKATPAGGSWRSAGARPRWATSSSASAWCSSTPRTTT